MKDIGNVTRGSGLLEEFLSKKRAEKANSLIPTSLRKGKILDIGCGSFPYFLTNTEFNEKFGIDPALNVNDIRGLRLKKVDVSKTDLPFADNFFDVVTMLAVFEHIEKEKLNLVLKETLRVLKKNGALIITTPSPWSDKLLHQMAKFGLISPEEIHEHKTHYNMKEIIDLFRQAGFQQEKINSGYFELGFNMWFVAKK